jgi:transaldolase
VRNVYNYCHQKGAKTKIIVSGMRTKNEAISLAGCDYLVIGPQVINALKSSVTLEGYNDGLRASEARFESLVPSLTPENAAASSVEELKVTKENFDDKIGMMGRDLLKGYVDRLTADAKRLEPLLLNQVGGQE